MKRVTGMPAPADAAVTRAAEMGRMHATPRVCEAAVEAAAMAAATEMGRAAAPAPMPAAEMGRVAAPAPMPAAMAAATMPAAPATFGVAGVDQRSAEQERERSDAGDRYPHG